MKRVSRTTGTQRLSRAKITVESVLPVYTGATHRTDKNDHLPEYEQDNPYPVDEAGDQAGNTLVIQVKQPCSPRQS